MAVGWGSDTASTQLSFAAGGAEQMFSQTPQLAANQYAHCQITGNSNGTTDSLIISVYSTTDTGYDLVAVYNVTLDCTVNDPNIFSLIVKDLYKFRIGVEPDGSTNTFTVDMSHRVATMS